MAIPAHNVPTLTAITDDQGRELFLLRCHYKYSNAAKAIPGYKWNPARKAWEYPRSSATYIKILRTFNNLVAEKSIQETMTLIDSQDSIQDIADVEPQAPMPILGTPYKHQVAAYNMGITQPHIALLMEQGCGKSLTAIAIAGLRFSRKEIKRLLIVAPASVVPVWPSEFALYANFEHCVTVPEGSIKQRTETLNTLPPTAGLRVVVINYEATWRMEEALLKWAPDMIIADESQRIKTPGARQSKCLHKLGRHSNYRLILTGTPVSQSPLDFFSQYKFLEPAIFGNSYWSFKAKHAIVGGYENRQIIGYKNLEELTQKAHSIAYRVTKESALDLPEFTDQLRYCVLEKDAIKRYNSMAAESVLRLSEEKVLTARNVLARLLRLSQLTGGFVNDGNDVFRVSSAKLNLLQETLEDLLMVEGKKVVIFARFLPELAAIRRMLENTLKVQYEWIAGEVKSENRGAAVSRFQNDPACGVFLAQIQTAGLGITLTAADTAIYYSLDYSCANLDQAKARLHRIGQKNNVTNIFLVAKKTVDEKVLQALSSKRSMADLVVDNWRSLFEEE